MLYVRTSLQSVLCQIHCSSTSVNRLRSPIVQVAVHSRGSRSLITAVRHRKEVTAARQLKRDMSGNKLRSLLMDFSFLAVCAVIPSIRSVIPCPGPLISFSYTVPSVSRVMGSLDTDPSMMLRRRGSPLRVIYYLVFSLLIVANVTYIGSRFRAGLYVGSREDQRGNEAGMTKRGLEERSTLLTVPSMSCDLCPGADDFCTDLG